MNFSMAADTEGSIGYNGGWGATPGPQGFYWGGTWICGATGTDNASLVKDIILKMTTDETIMKDIVVKDDDFVNNKPAMEAMAADTSYQSKVLGGQNPLSMYCASVEKLDLSNKPRLPDRRVRLSLYLSPDGEKAVSGVKRRADSRFAQKDVREGML